MGAANSVEVPGGGTEGYHVLRVSISISIFFGNRRETVIEREMSASERELCIQKNGRCESVG